MRVETTHLDLSMDELDALMERAKAAMPEADYQTLEKLVGSYLYVGQLLENERMTIKRLKKLLFGDRTEKTRDVAKAAGAGDASQSDDPSKENASQDGQSQASDASEAKKKPRGHGRNGAAAYRGAQTVWIDHATLKSGDPCPNCQNGKVYQQKDPRCIVRIVGQAPVEAKVYQLEKLRCNLCGKRFTADAPEDLGSEKYDATTGSIIALLRYGNGMPFNRLERLQEGFGIPLPSSTQWDIVNEEVNKVVPAFEELIRQAAQGDVVHNDDTNMRILEFMGKRAEARAEAQADTEKASERTGVFTSGIVSAIGGHQIGLFFTGHKHAGENLEQVLAHRATELGPPIQMCDALSRNLPKELEVIVANCLAHGRRQFVDLADIFPEQCLHVLEVFKKVYEVDARAKGENLTPQQRLALHQAESGSVMEDLHQWLTEQLEGKHVEPNSSLGKATKYLLNHWKELTLFLREAGAPLDNNICERALKMSIRHRKNSLFYKTERGAYVGDVYMSLIHTCYLNGVDPFDYLTALHRHPEQVAANPGAWMPWNYPADASRAPPS
ncbi:MAG: IS66 family transposase [Verrucomicrobiota bacterium]|jgi:transposase|nr:IS66 family transposase [Verrucomicrobiota bacterium]|tara:strand:+ start:1880 stop:3544 length:1665 start_codon:yes stop_codon:yes gene_type:complete